MPVINLPQDTRFGDLGKGVGQIVGALVGGYAQSQIQSGVGAMLQDTSISADKLPGEVFKKFGNPGIETLAKLNALKEQQATITQKLAGAGLATVQAALDQAKLPSEAARAAGVAATAQAQPAHIAAETEQAAASAARTRALTGPEVAGSQALTGLRENESREAGTRADILTERLGRMRTGGSELNLDAQLAPFNLTPQETAAAKLAWKGAEEKSPGSGDAAMSGYVRNLVTSRTKTEQPKPLTEPEQRFSSDSVQHATSALKFIDTFRKGGSRDIGFFSGANAKAFMERWGIPTGDVDLVNMWNSAQQQVASAATQGGGFFAQGRVKLAHDVTAGITETPLHALLATDQVADRQIAALEGRLSGFEGTSVNTKPIQAALQKWRDVKSVTGSFRSEVIPNPRAPNDPAQGRTVAFFDNAQINPKTFVPIVKNDDTKYELSKGKTVPGSWLFEAARVKNKDPETLLNELRATVR